MTAIYKTGTVSVNNGSNIVTGNGTSFIDVANVQEGDLFTVDGQKFYEAYEVDTNTQIKIRNIVTGGAFAETNVTAGNFAIIRNFTSQTSAEIAGKVLAVQQKWMNREEEMTDWFYTANDWATVTSINGDELSVMTPNGINNLLGTAAAATLTTSNMDTTVGRVLKVGDAGILTHHQVISGSIDDLFLPMDYIGYGGLHANATTGDNPFPDYNGAFSLHVNKAFSKDTPDFATQFAIKISSGNASPHSIEAKFRTISGNTNGWTPWMNVMHSGNTNFNKIGGSTANAYAKGFAVNTTTARFFKQLHSSVNCTGISPTDGSVGFTVKATNGVGYQTGVLPSTFSFAGVSSTEFMIFDVTVSASMTTGETLWLQAGDSDSFAEATF